MHQMSAQGKTIKTLMCRLLRRNLENVGVSYLSTIITNKLEYLVWLLLHQDFCHLRLSRVEEC
jgi:hypothetical protein